MSTKPLASILIPARDEAENLPATISRIAEKLGAEKIPYEILVLNDLTAAEDVATTKAIDEIQKKFSEVFLHNFPKSEKQGFGLAIQRGLQLAKGDYIMIAMADGSESPDDMVACYRKMGEGYDAVLGSRFVPGGVITNYPAGRIFLNRAANWFLSLLFLTRFNDFTNAFKCYSRGAISGMQPVFSRHFNITIELPLKVVARKMRYAVIPIRWDGKPGRSSSLNARKMARRYLYTALVIFLEKFLVWDDYS